MARKLIIPLSAALVGVLITASPALAATTDCAGLQQALDDATDGTTVTLAEGSACTDSYSLPSGTDVVLEGGGAGAALIGDGESQLLDGFGVGDVVVRNLHFDGGRTAGDGAAIFIAGYDAVTIADNVFTDNDSGSSGGAVAIRQQFDTVTLADREAQGAEEPGGVTIDGNDFGGNNADEDGGALSIDVQDTVALTDNVFEENTSHRAGGGAAVSFCREATVAGNTFDDNSAASFFQGNRAPASEVSGGHVQGGGLAIGSANCFEQFPQERAAQGLPQSESVVRQSGNDFLANGLATGENGDADGAGEYVAFATLVSTDDVFHGNVIGAGSNGSGGGLYVASFADTTLRNFVATANTMQSGGNGGGVYYGGRTTTLRLVHATIAGNSLEEGQGSAVYGQAGQTLLVDNSIVHGNTGGPELSGFDTDVPASVPAGDVEVDFSLACTEDGKAHDGEGNLCADPKLADVAGGDVHQTAASPTHDKASKDLSDGLEKDYEGEGRFLDYDRGGAAEPDMGADEAPAPPAQTTTTEQPKPTPAASGGVLGTQARSCTSRRSFRIKLRNRGQKVVKATVIVNGKRVKVLRGKRLTSRVDLRGLPKGRFSVRIRLKLANGDTISGVRRYYTCRPGRRSGPPKV